MMGTEINVSDILNLYGVGDPDCYDKTLQEISNRISLSVDCKNIVLNFDLGVFQSYNEEKIKHMVYTIKENYPNIEITIGLICQGKTGDQLHIDFGDETIILSERGEKQYDLRPGRLPKNIQLVHIGQDEDQRLIHTVDHPIK